MKTGTVQRCHSSLSFIHGSHKMASSKGLLLPHKMASSMALMLLHRVVFPLGLLLHRDICCFIVY